MSESKHSKHGNERQEHDSAQHDQLPYWKRMHQDWRFWVGVFFMVAAISVYVLTNNLSLVPSRQPQLPSSGAAGK